MSGKVEQFVQIIPNTVVFNGDVGKPLKKAVRITPGEKYPFKITGSRARYGQNIRYHLDTKKRFGKTTYLLEVENTRNMPGRYSDYIYLDTDSAIQSTLTIKVRGDIIYRPKEGASTSAATPSPGEPE